MVRKRSSIMAIFMLALVLPGCKNPVHSVIKTITVSFDSDGGSSIGDQIIEPGMLAEEPPDPARSNIPPEGLYEGTTPGSYIFDGWYNGEERWEFNTPVTEDLLLTAKWIVPALINVSRIFGFSIVEKAAIYLSDAEPGIYTLVIADDCNVDPVSIDTDGVILSIVSMGEERIIRIADGYFNSLIKIGAGVTLILNNNITLQGRSNNYGSLINIGPNGSLVMNEGAKIIGNEIVAGDFGEPMSKDGGGVAVYKDGTFTMNGGLISGNKGGNGGGVYINEGEFIMNGGIISENTADNDFDTGAGGGVFLQYGNFTMNNDAEISGNRSVENGGGVYADNSSVFTMNNGTISGNSSENDRGYGEGGGVYICDAEFIMGSGTITDNEAWEGGGVRVYNGGSFEMNGDAVISRNRASSGGGVSIYDAEFSMAGMAKILNNSSIIDDDEGGCGGGVYIGKYGSFEMSGSAAISLNTAEFYGGGVYISDEGVFTYSDYTISGNTAVLGNGIFIDEGGSFDYIGGSFGEYDDIYPDPF